MGATHFLMKTLPRVASEMALHVLAYNTSWQGIGTRLIFAHAGMQFEIASCCLV